MPPPPVFGGVGIAVGTGEGFTGAVVAVGGAGAVVGVGVFFGFGVGVGEVGGADVGVGGADVAVAVAVAVGIGVFVGVGVGGTGGLPIAVGMNVGGGGGVLAAANVLDAGECIALETANIPTMTGNAKPSVRRLFIQDSLRFDLRSGRLVAAYISLLAASLSLCVVCQPSHDSERGPALLGLTPARLEGKPTRTGSRHPPFHVRSAIITNASTSTFPSY